MGQYYRPCVLSDDKKNVINTVDCYDFNNGAKLMEHSYLKNQFVGAFCALIDADAKENDGLLNGACCGYPVVWCGDYADDLAWTKRQEKNDKGVVVELSDNYYSLSQGKEIKVSDVTPVFRRYAVNDTKNEFVDLSKAPEIEGWGAQIHALPLLLAMGNGRGGGDYSGNLMALIGRWAGDVVVVTDKEPVGMNEVIATFVEYAEDNVEPTIIECGDKEVETVKETPVSHSDKEVETIKVANETPVKSNLEIQVEELTAELASLRSVVEENANAMRKMQEQLKAVSALLAK